MKNILLALLFLLLLSADSPQSITNRSHVQIVFECDKREISDRLAGYYKAGYRITALTAIECGESTCGYEVVMEK